jgi:hypothetical protein
MGRPPGRIQDKPLNMRASAGFIAMIDRWRARQPDKPTRAEAIRRLVSLGLKAKGK